MPSRLLSPGELYGVTNRTWRTELATFTVLHHAHPRAVPAHAHAHMYLGLLLAGGYREWVADPRERALVYRPLTLVFHPRNFEHRDEIIAPDSRFFTIEIDPGMVGDELAAGLLASLRDLSGGPAVWSMLRLLEALLRGHRDPLDGEEQVAEILAGLLGGRPEAAPAPGWLACVEARLRDDHASAITLRGLAELAGVHPIHLARVFRHVHGTSMRAYLRRQRVLAASRAIAAGQPLADAAVATGFCDQSHLTRAFKRVTGMTPGQYRTLVGRA